jgi:hypothetical protein
MGWHVSNRNRWAETVSDPDILPFFYVISDNGILLERDDGEIRQFRKPETAKRAAAKLNDTTGADHDGQR